MNNSYHKWIEKNMMNKLKDSLVKRKRYLHTNLNHLLNEHDLDIQALSDKTGVPIATIFRMKKEDNNPTLSSLEPLTEYFKIELNDFLYVDISSEVYQKKKAVENVQYIPVTNLADIKKWPIQHDKKIYVGTNGDLSKASFGILINTNSMAPIFYANTVLVVDPNVTEKDNDYIFCQLKNDSTPVLRQLFIDGNNYFFKPINPGYGEMIHITKFTILGVIMKSIEHYR